MCLTKGRLHLCHHQINRLYIRRVLDMPSSGEISPYFFTLKKFFKYPTSYNRDDYREARRTGRGVLVRGRAAQVIAQESMEEHIRGSVERLDTQFSTLHQDVATLSYEVNIAVNVRSTLNWPNVPDCFV